MGVHGILDDADCVFRILGEKLRMLIVNRVLKINTLFVNEPLKLLSPEALSSPQCTKYRLAAGLRPDLLEELTALPWTL